MSIDERRNYEKEISGLWKKNLIIFLKEKTPCFSRTE